MHRVNTERFTSALRTLAVGLSMGLTLALSACGGGGGSDLSSPYSAPATVPTPTPSTYTIGGTVTGLTAGQTVTLQNNGGDTLTVSANGAFTFTSTQPGSSAYSVTVGTQPTAQFCAVTSGSGMTITANVTSIDVSCGAHNVYVADAANAQIFQYVIQSNGTLAPLAAPVVTTLGGSNGLAVDPSGKYLYAGINGHSEVEQFNIGADGSLTPMATPSVPSGSNPYAVAVSPNGKFVFVGNGGGSSVTSYTVGSDGSLTPVGTYSCSIYCQNTQGLAVNPSSTFLYVVGAQNSYISVMSISANGSLSNVQNIGTPTTNPAYDVVDPTGAYLLTSSHGEVVVFPINASTGLLGTVQSVTLPIYGVPGAQQMVFDPSGQHFYQSFQNPPSVDQYSWNATSGTLTALSPTSVAAGPSTANIQGMAIDPSGQYVYTVNRTSNNISQFVVGSGGVLSLNPVSNSVSVPSSPTPDPYAIAIRG